MALERGFGWLGAAALATAVTVCSACSAGADPRGAAPAPAAASAAPTVRARYEPWPIVAEISLGLARGACVLSRSGPDGTCRVAARPAETALVVTSLQAAADAALAWRDDCGGAFTALDTSGFPAYAVHAWTAPAGDGPRVCTLAPELSRSGMVDRFPIAVLVAP